MKTNAIVSLFASAFVSSAHGALFIQEQFLSGTDPAAGQYVANAAVTGTGPTGGTIQGFTGNWLNGGAAGPTSVANGLTYSDGTNSLQTAGGSLNAAANIGLRAGRVVTSPITATTTGTFYLSVLLQTNLATGGNYRSLELHNGGFADGVNRKLQIGIGGTGTDFNGSTNFGLRVNNSDTLRTNLGVGNLNSNLFVLKFVLGATANSDSITVYANPTLGTEPAVATGTLSGFDFLFDRVSLANFQTNGGSLAMDEFRFGDSYASVTPIPEPSALVLSVFGSLALLRRKR